MFERKPPKVQIIEIEKGTKLPPLTNELKESIRTLQGHPGFQYLQAKRRYERAQLQKILNEGFQLSEVEMKRLQAGIFYLSYDERELNSLMRVPQVSREATDDEMERFKAVQASIDLVG